MNPHSQRPYLGILGRRACQPNFRVTLPKTASAEDLDGRPLRKLAGAVDRDGGPLQNSQLPWTAMEGHCKNLRMPWTAMEGRCETRRCRGPRWRAVAKICRCRGPRWEGLPKTRGWRGKRRGLVRRIWRQQCIQKNTCATFPECRKISRPNPTSDTSLGLFFYKHPLTRVHREQSSQCLARAWGESDD